MMAGNVEVKIHSVQIDSGGEQTEAKVTACGKIREKGGRHFVRYGETDEDGAVTHTLIKVGCDQAQIIRSGQISSSFTYSVGKPCRAQYVTPYGSFLVDIDTDRYEVDEAEESLRLKLAYLLSIEEGPAARCRADIEVHLVPAQAGEAG